MITGPALCAVAIICFVLTGPMGPCGPSSPLGLPLLLTGVLTGAVGWITSLGALLRAAWGASRSELLWPAAVAASATGALAAIAAFTTAEGPQSSSAATTAVVSALPPITAASAAVARWLRKRSVNDAPTTRRVTLAARHTK